MTLQWSMTIRTTVAFDPATVARWERLTRRWGISKSETLRRALESAEKEGLDPAIISSDAPDFSVMMPVGIMAWLKEHPQVPAGWGNSVRAEVQTARDRDAEVEAERVECPSGTSRKSRSVRP